MNRPAAKPAPKRESLGIHFGALALPLSKQLVGKGLSNDTVECLQKDADAVTRLVVRGFIPEAAAKRARSRIMKNIVEAVLVARKAGAA